MTTEPETPEYIYEPWGKYALRTLKNIVLVIAGMFALGLAITAAGYGYDQLDLNGYISHDRTLDVYMTSNWLVGENRVCSLVQRYDPNGKPLGQLDSLQCPVGFENLEPHNLSVTFKGIVAPEDIDGTERTIPAQWTCTRGSDNFTCKPLATPTKP